jgi:hypothetical protein
VASPARPRDHYLGSGRSTFAAWQVSTTADVALPHVDGPYPRGYKLRNWFDACER